MKPLLWDAINPITGTPFRLDDPNLFWSDPSYYLEPGDPGFVPYANTSPKQTRQKSNPNTMIRQPYYPSRVAEQLVWLENFRNKLAGHAATLGLTPAECADAIADARWLIYVLGSWLPAAKAWSLACTDAARQAQGGDGSVLMVLPTFTPPALPAAVGGQPAVVPVNAGALDRIFAIVQIIKDATGFIDSIGSDLGVIGTTVSAPDLSIVQPLITLKHQGDRVLVGWGWGGLGRYLDQCEIHVDRGSGFSLLTSDTTPDYIDSTPPPATPTKWTYKAIFRVDDAQVGLWSTPVSITVGG